MWWMRSAFFGLCGAVLIVIGPTAGARVAGAVAVAGQDGAPFPPTHEAPATMAR